MTLLRSFDFASFLQPPLAESVCAHAVYAVLFYISVICYFESSWQTDQMPYIVGKSILHVEQLSGYSFVGEISGNYTKYIFRRVATAVNVYFCFYKRKRNPLTSHWQPIDYLVQSTEMRYKTNLLQGFLRSALGQWTGRNMEPFGKKLRIKSKANAPVLFFREDDEAWLHSRENCAHARKEIRKNARILECLLVQDYRKSLLLLPASDFVISALGKKL